MGGKIVKNLASPYDYQINENLNQNLTIVFVYKNIRILRSHGLQQNDFDVESLCALNFSATSRHRVDLATLKV